MIVFFSLIKEIKLKSENTITCRVSCVQKNFFTLLPCEKDNSRKVKEPVSEIAGKLKGKFYNLGLEPPVVGDYVSITLQTGARPVVILSKADLCDDVNLKVEITKAVILQLTVSYFSCKMALGLWIHRACEKLAFLIWKRE